MHLAQSRLGDTSRAWKVNTWLHLSCRLVPSENTLMNGVRVHVSWLQGLVEMCLPTRSGGSVLRILKRGWIENISDSWSASRTERRTPSFKLAKSGKLPEILVTEIALGEQGCYRRLQRGGWWSMGWLMGSGRGLCGGDTLQHAGGASRKYTGILCAFF